MTQIVAVTSLINSYSMAYSRGKKWLARSLYCLHTVYVRAAISLRSVRARS